LRKRYLSTSVSMLMAAFMLATISFVAPASAWYGPTYVGPVGTEDGRFEMFGPRVDNVLIKMYSYETFEWEALKAGEIDITDFKLTKEYYDAIMSGAYPDLAVADSGGELDMWVLDINNNDQLLDWGGLPIEPNPFGDETLVQLPSEHPYLPSATVTRGSQARLALANLLNRTAIIDATGNMHNSMYTHMPESSVFRIGGWINDDASKYPFNPQLASTILTMAGYADTEPDGWFNDPRTGANIVLKFYTRTDTFRKTLGDWIETRLEGSPGGSLPNLRDFGPGIMVDRYVPGGPGIPEPPPLTSFNLRTGSWLLSREPTHYYYLYHSKFYWPDPWGNAPNYFNVHDPEIDRLSELIYFAPDVPTAKQAVLDIQVRMNEPDAVFNIPVANTIGRKAFKKTSADTGTYWLGLINSVGYGINTAPSAIDSFLNAHPEGVDTGGTIKYGWKFDTMPTSLNPFQYYWFWDADVIFRVYNTLLAVNPYDPMGGGPSGYPPGDLPWIAKSGEIETWSPDGGVTINSKFTFYLRDDVYFHDGTQMTAEDVWYTIKLGFYQAEDHSEYGWWALPPSFWSYIMDIDVSKTDEEVMPDGPLGYKIVLYYKIRSIWAFWWASAGIPVVPKAKWWDRFVPDPTGSDGFAPDPQMIGTGPFRIYPGRVDGTDPEHYTPGSHIKLDKNPTFFNLYRQAAATLDINPETLNLLSKGRWITAYIELTQGNDVSNIDTSSIMLNNTIPVDLAAPTNIGDHDGDGSPDLMIKFIRRDVTSLIINELQTQDEFSMVTLTITGNLNDGTPFTVSCTIKTIGMTQRRPARDISPI